VAALNNERPAAPNQLRAYLNEFEGVVPDTGFVPICPMATDVSLFPRKNSHSFTKGQRGGDAYDCLKK